VELSAGFLADATPGGWICEDFGGFEDLLGDGKVFGDARGAGLFGGLPVGGDFSRRSGVCGSGGGGFFAASGPSRSSNLAGSSDSLFAPKMRRQPLFPRPPVFPNRYFRSLPQKANS